LAQITSTCRYKVRFDGSRADDVVRRCLRCCSVKVSFTFVD